MVLQTRGREQLTGTGRDLCIRLANLKKLFNYLLPDPEKAIIIVFRPRINVWLHLSLSQQYYTNLGLRCGKMVIKALLVCYIIVL